MPTETELSRIIETTHGRAFPVKVAIEAIQAGVLEPIQPDYSAYAALARRGLAPQSRAVAELLAVINRDADVPLDLLAAAASNLGIDNVAAALDQLTDRRQIERRGDRIALLHAVVHRSWRDTLTASHRKRLGEAWFSAVSSFGVARLVSDEAAGLMPIIAVPLVDAKSDAEITEISQRLIAIGQYQTGLALLDRRWKFDAESGGRSANMLEQALLAARTRLELGRYAEVDEPLAQAENAADKGSAAAIEALLLRMKLSLRRNSYTTLSAIAGKLASEGMDTEAQIESELILNVAHRDVLDLASLDASVTRLQALRSSGSAKQQNEINRSLARSLAKLGRSEEAIAEANAAVDTSSRLDSIRAVGNAYLALAEVLRYRAAHEEAISAYRKAAEIGRAMGNRDSQLWSLLGEASAHIEAGASTGANAALSEIAALLAEPGYQHPLETAHNNLLRTLSRPADEVSFAVVDAYQSLGITWPKEYLQRYADAKGLPGPIPL